VAGTAHIYQSLIVNLLIASAKGVAAVVTGSGAMLAETIHSGADCGNQMLLLLGVKKSKKPPDAEHPLGYGRTLYFWSFMVAMLLFVGGGAFSIYEGVHKLQSPEPVHDVWLGFAILGFSLGLEGWATYGNIRELDKRRGATPFWRFLRETKDSDLVVVFGENSAAVLGLVLAMASLVVAWQTGNPMWDAVGSLCIGVVLVAVAVFLAIEVQSLLVGERADPKIEAAVLETIRDDDRMVAARTVVTVQQGPGEVMVCVKIRCRADVPVSELSDLINSFEARLRGRCPEAKWCYVEPDLSA